MMFQVPRTLLAATAALGALLVATPLSAQSQKPAGQPESLGQYGAWQVFKMTGPKGDSCFAISSPTSREPTSLKRDPATFFVSHRPSEGVKNEISLIVGFPMAEGGDAKITIGGSTYALYAKESNAWVKNAAEEATVIGVMKRGKDLVFEAKSRRGNTTKDTYSLSGLTQALDTIAACKKQ